MRLAEIIEHYSPVYPQDMDWAVTVEHMLNDPAEKLIIDDLLEVLRSNRTFRESILLGPGYWDFNEGVPSVLDGTHRVVALIIHNDPVLELSVRHEGQEDDEIPESEFPDQEIFANTEIIFERPITEDEYDIAFTTFRSLKINDDLWVNSDLASGRDEMFSCTWNINQNRMETDALQKIHETIIERARSTDFLHSFPAIREIISYWEDWDEENSKYVKLDVIKTVP